MKAYFISGLGADSRVFLHIRLPANYSIVHLAWISPLKNESLRSYALRLAEKIDSSEPFILVGLSMGGMIATEITKILVPVKTILISSVSSSSNLPGYIKYGRVVPVHKFIPVTLLKKASFIKRFFTNEAGPDKKLLRTIIRESDPAFIKWGMQAVVNWECEMPNENIIHIHGSADRILPAKYAVPTHIIKGGGHMIVVENAAEVNKILLTAL